VVGLTFSPDGDLTNWQMTPPILIADGVNQELERPHFIFREGKYYLFIDTHTFTFAPGLMGPEGMYGFVSDSLRGEYQPLNGSGLVLANPPEQPYQAYSWLMLPDLRVYSFINYFDLGDLALDEVGEQSEEFQRSRFGGTFAPVLHIEFTSATTTRVVGGASAPPAAPNGQPLFLPLVVR
jgi:levansucrase